MSSQPNMDSYIYQEIAPNEKKQSSYVIFFRQVFVSSGIWTFFFLFGVYLGAPTVFIPQIRSEANSTSAISDETASSISAVYGLAGTPWIYISAFLTLRYGKKLTLILLSMITLSGAIVFYCSTNLTQIFISEGILSLIGASFGTLCLLTVSEYSSPRYRGFFLAIKSASLMWGVWVSNAIGTFFHWKNIGIFGIICSLYPLLSIPFWPESPYWLANMGRFEDCIASHRWLRGSDEEAEKELKGLMTSKVGGSTTHASVLCDKNLLSNIRKKQFYKPVILALILMSNYYVCGKMVYVVYAIDVIKNMTGSVSTAYIGMLVLDGFSVLSTYFGCILSKFYKRRVLIFSFSNITCFLLFIISLYLFLIDRNVCAENAYISIFLLSLYSMAVCAGPIVLTTSVSAELLPLKNRILSICIFATTERILFTITMKAGPYSIKEFGLAMVFFAFGVMTTIITFILYLYLPETKDKTLQEIESCMRGEDKCLKDDANELNLIKSECDP